MEARLLRSDPQQALLRRRQIFFIRLPRSEPDTVYCCNALPMFIRRASRRRPRIFRAIYWRGGRNLDAAERELFFFAYRARDHIELNMIDFILPPVEKYLVAAPVSKFDKLHSPLTQDGVFRNLNINFEYITREAFFRRKL